MVQGAAFTRSSHTEIDSNLLGEARKQKRIVEAYALIEYPKGEILDADENVGEKLRSLFRQEHVQFDWALSRDEKAPPKSYTVSLEVIVEKAGQL